MRWYRVSTVLVNTNPGIIRLVEKMRYSLKVVYNVH